MCYSTLEAAMSGWWVRSAPIVSGGRACRADFGPGLFRKMPCNKDDPGGYSERCSQYRRRGCARFPAESVVFQIQWFTRDRRENRNAGHMKRPAFDSVRLRLRVEEIREGFSSGNANAGDIVPALRYRERAVQAETYCHVQTASEVRHGADEARVAEELDGEEVGRRIIRGADASAVVRPVAQLPGNTFSNLALGIGNIRVAPGRPKMGSR